MTVIVEVSDCLGRILGRCELSPWLSGILRDTANGNIESGSVVMRCDNPSNEADFVQVWLKVSQ